jgi:hypothetical protein
MRRPLKRSRSSSVTPQRNVPIRYAGHSERFDHPLRYSANLASEFTAKLTEARSIPEAMSASQEWTTRRLQMMAKDGQQLAAVIQKLAETSARLVAPHELVMRILKLRWIGMESEAEKMETTLHRIAPESTLVRGPADTD